MARIGTVHRSNGARDGSHAAAVGHVKAAGRRLAHTGTAILITLLSALPIAAAAAEPSFTRPAPNIERQIDRLERQGAVDPVERRRLQDQLRRTPRGPERAAAERRLGELPDATPPVARPLPEAPRSDPLPSSLSPGFGGSRDGYMVPPGGRSGGAR